MGRIRTIKPEFPQSETIGRLSRDARLLFVQLWTIVDDDGRTRAASRMLASLLYPYDDDAPGLIDGWLGELEAAGCIRRYEAEGGAYLDIPNWLKHQKISHPSKSRLPSFPEDSGGLRKSSEVLRPDLGPRTLDHGPVPRTSSDAPPAASPARGTRFSLEALPDEWRGFCQTERPDLDPSATFDLFRDHWIAAPAQRGVKRDWDATWRNWVRREKRAITNGPPKSVTIEDVKTWGRQ